MEEAERGLPSWRCLIGWKNKNALVWWWCLGPQSDDGGDDGDLGGALAVVDEDDVVWKVDWTGRRRVKGTNRSQWLVMACAVASFPRSWREAGGGGGGCLLLEAWSWSRWWAWRRLTATGS